MYWHSSCIIALAANATAANVADFNVNAHLDNLFVVIVTVEDLLLENVFLAVAIDQILNSSQTKYL